MRIKAIENQLQSKFIQDYYVQDKQTHQFFDYNPFLEKDYQNRLKELSQRPYKREQLSEVLMRCNEKWGASDKTFENIRRIKQKESVVVVGGQQAGLLMGPLYTLNKLISIIKHAEELEKKHQIPVIPVFWIAGEDHDFQEINHIHMPVPPRMKKFKILQRQLKKESISSMKLDQVEVEKWLDNVFTQIDETERTSSLLHQFKAEAKQSETYVDFFARLVFSVIKDYGIVLMDSHDPSIRKLESDYFVKMISKQEVIAKGVKNYLNKTGECNYSVSLDAEINDGHLFFHLNDERILLQVNAHGEWEGKNGEITFTVEELLDIAQNQPWLLSNNVVTRPLMQDLLLPVLSFIGGPGEIAYWSVLKPVFRALDIKMPPVVPRLSFTYVDRKTEKILSQLAINEKDALQSGGVDAKGNWLKRQTSPPIEELVDHVKLTIERTHRPLQDLARELKPDLGQVAEKNLTLLFREIDYLEYRLTSEIKKKHQKVLEKYDWIDVLFRPEGGLQERTWNIVNWLNIYGIEWIDELIKQDTDWSQNHYFVYL